MKFANRAQQKAVMAKLKQEGYNTRPKKITAEGKYFRARIRNPDEFQKDSFRTLDVGQKGHTKVIIGRPKGQTTSSTQSVLIDKSDVLRQKSILRR